MRKELNLSEKVLAKARMIQSKAKFLANDQLIGEYTSVFKGRGLEFEEVREYQEGDDVRDIDWKVTARFQKNYVKTYKDERELTIYFLVDVSMSTRFQGIGKTKEEVIAEITALLSYASLKSKDKISLIIFSEDVEHYVPPGRGRGHVWKIIREILDFKPRSKGTNINAGLEFLKKVRKRKAIVFLMSDFFDEGYEKNLKYLSRKHDFNIFCVSDPIESSFIKEIKGFFRFRDLETGKEKLLNLSSKKNTDAYEHSKENRLERIGKLSKDLGSNFLNISTNGDHLDQVVRFFRSKKARR